LVKHKDTRLYLLLYTYRPCVYRKAFLKKQQVKNEENMRRPPLLHEMWFTSHYLRSNEAS